MTCHLCWPLWRSSGGCRSHISRCTSFHALYLLLSCLHRPLATANPTLITSKTQDIRWSCMTYSLCWPFWRSSAAYRSQISRSISFHALYFLLSCFHRHPIAGDSPLTTCRTQDIGWSCITCSLCWHPWRSSAGWRSCISRSTFSHDQYFLLSCLHIPPAAANAPLITSKMLPKRWSCMTCSLCWPLWRSSAGCRSHISKDVFFHAQYFFFSCLYRPPVAVNPLLIASKTLNKRWSSMTCSLCWPLLRFSEGCTSHISKIIFFSALYFLFSYFHRPLAAANPLLILPKRRTLDGPA